MKLDIRTDFTSLPRATSVLRAKDRPADLAPAFDLISLPHDERHLRRKVLTLVHGDRVLVDLPEPVVLEERDRLMLEDGRNVEVFAVDEEVYEITARDPVHLSELCWHIGNRHLAAEIEKDRVLILRDHVIRSMLEGLGATVRDVAAPFHPLRGAYSGPGDSHGHHHHHHDHDERDQYGRLPGDPHYGHNHG